MSTCFQKSVRKLHPDHFDGDPTSWMKRYSIFQATIDEASMTPADMMNHLQSLSTGEAKALVDGYGCNGTYELQQLIAFKNILEIQSEL